jgi:multicomponent Na+:H+ antiporter subunit C
MIEWIIQEIFTKYNYWISIIIMLTGLYATVAKSNLLKKIIGLSIFQTAIFLFFISLADVGGGTSPIVCEEMISRGYKIYVNPLPHVLMLTGIVVAAATLAVALALVIRLYEEYGTIEEDEIVEKEMEIERGAVR